MNLSGLSAALEKKERTKYRGEHLNKETTLTTKRKRITKNKACGSNWGVQSSPIQPVQ